MYNLYKGQKHSKTLLKEFKEILIDFYHSDQGSQYKSPEYEETIKHSGMPHSFSRKGYPYHNPSLEIYHGHLKREWGYQLKHKDFEEVYQTIF